MSEHHGPVLECTTQRFIDALATHGGAPRGVLKVSRRAALWTGATGLAAVLVPARAGAQTKIAPKMVQYQEKPKGPQECDNCLQFVAPASCKLVDGKINPKGWCQLYAPKPK